jgi:hypothetical protein
MKSLIGTQMSSGINLIITVLPLAVRMFSGFENGKIFFLENAKLPDRVCSVHTEENSA